MYRRRHHTTRPMRVCACVCVRDPPSVKKRRRERDFFSSYFLFLSVKRTYKPTTPPASTLDIPPTLQPLLLGEKVYTCDCICKEGEKKMPPTVATLPHKLKKKERFLHPPSSHTPTQAHRLMKRCILLPMCASVCMHVYVGLPALAGIFFPSWSMSSFAARLIPAHSLHPSPPLFRTKGCACACMCVPFLCAVGMPPTAYRLTSQRHGLRAPTLSYVFCGSYQTLLFSTTHTSTPTMCRSSSSLRLYLSSAALLREGRPQPTPFCIT